MPRPRPVSSLIVVAFPVALAGCFGFEAPPNRAPASLPPAETYGTRENAPMGAKPVEILTEDFHGAIFQAEERPPSADARYWAPSEEEVTRAERAARAYVRKWSLEVASKLPKYKRQYVGALSGDERFLEMNFYCAVHGPEWLFHRLYFSETDDCFFRLRYSMKTGQLVPIQ